MCLGSCDAVFMWWDTWTDPDCSILLSCAPSWAHHNLAMGAELPWRDHWMQAIYYPRTHTTAVKVRCTVWRIFVVTK